MCIWLNNIHTHTHKIQECFQWSSSTHNQVGENFKINETHIANLWKKGKLNE